MGELNMTAELQGLPRQGECRGFGFYCDFVDRCFPPQWICDADLDDYCTKICVCHGAADKNCSDVRCPSLYFACDNGRCLDNILLCNDKRDCADEYDELPENCHETKGLKYSILGFILLCVAALLLYAFIHYMHGHVDHWRHKRKRRREMLKHMEEMPEIAMTEPKLTYIMEPSGQVRLSYVSSSHHLSLASVNQRMTQHQLGTRLTTHRFSTDKNIPSVIVEEQSEEPETYAFHSTTFDTTTPVNYK